MTAKILSSSTKFLTAILDLLKIVTANSRGKNFVCEYTNFNLLLKLQLQIYFKYEYIDFTLLLTLVTAN